MARKTDADKRYEELDQLFEVPMVGAAFALLAIIIIQQVFDPTGFFGTVLTAMDWFIWLAFLIELMVLTYYAPDKKKHLVSHWYDVLIVLIPILRLTRLFALLGILEIEQISGLLSRFAGGASESSFIVRTFALLSKGVREARRFIVEHKFNYIFGTLVLIILFLGSIATVFESGHPQANIKTLGDGIWWSLVSVTTVGYGDRYPVTLAGRTVGVILMTLGVTAFSLLTANIASFLVGEKDEEEKRRVHRRLDEIEEKLDEIRKKLGNKK